jgi:ATP-dependent helicase/nuclease subunit A
MTGPAHRDDAARRRAATDVSTNLVVSAGAGTGKTSLLVERVLVAIASGFTTLPEIAAITFTEKAAGEMRHRLAAGLDELAVRAAGGVCERNDTAAARAFDHVVRAGAGPAEVAARAAEATAALDRAVISTIHGFCSDLLRSHPIEAALPPVFTVDNGAKAKRLAEGPWAEYVARELGAAGERRDIWERALATVSLAEAAEIAMALAAGSVPGSLLVDGVRTLDLHEALGGTAQAWADALQQKLATDGLTKAPFEWIEEAERVLRSFASDGLPAARRTMDACTRVPGAMPKVRSRVSPEHAAALEQLASTVEALLKGLDALDEAGMAAVLEAVLPFVRGLREARVREGLLDFDALLVRARDLLRDVPSVRAALKRRFRMILLDEFQDTDPLQYEIVFFAAEAAGDLSRDAYATRLAPGMLFIVGDAKQSIYRFRGADYAAYRRAVAHVLGQGGVELSLTTNYRATAAVLKPVNALFASPGSVAWVPSQFLPAYESIEPYRNAAPEAPAVEIWSAASGAANASERRLLEGRAVAAELAVTAGPGTALAYSDVLLLLRGFGEVTPYLRALREAGIPFVVSGGRTFFERTEIVQAMALLRAVADPDHEVALLAYLRSPAGGVDDVELAAHADARGTWNVDAAVDAARCPALAAALTRLKALREEVASLPVDAAILRLIHASGLMVLSGLAFEAGQRVANLEKLVLAANALARDGHLDLSETLDAIEDSLEFDEESDSPLADETLDAVRVMTIHKAKGLEAKLVVLADVAADRSHRQPREWKAGFAAFPSGEHVLLRGPRSIRNGAALAASLEDRPHDDAEHVRLLYVALTRARDRLIVVAGKSRSSAWIDALRPWGYDPETPPPDGATLAGGTVLHRVIASPRPAARPESTAVPGAPEAVARHDAALCAIAAAPRSEFRAPSLGDERGGGIPDEESGSLRPELAREVGTLIHARLAGLPARSADPEVTREADAVGAAFAASPLVARLDSLNVLGREVPLLFDDGEQRWHGAIDLLYRDADGTIVVADFKTDASPDGAIDRHRIQLDVYARAVRRVFPDDRVRAELWMLRTGTVLAV